MTIVLQNRPARTATQQFASRSGQSFIDQILDLMKGKFNRIRLMHSWPGARALAYDQISEQTGLSRRTLQQYASIIDKLATKHQPATHYAKPADSRLAPYDPTFLLAIRNTNLDKAREVDALCQLRDIPAEWQAINRALNVGEPVSAISRLAALNERRKTGLANIAISTAIDVASWPQQDRDRFLLAYRVELLRNTRPDDSVSANDIANTLSVAARSFIELHQNGLDNLETLRERTLFLAGLEGQIRNMKAATEATFDSENVLAKRAAWFAKNMGRIAGIDSEMPQAPSNEAAIFVTNAEPEYLEGFRFFTRSTRTRHAKTVELIATRETIDQQKIDALVEKNLMYELKVLPKLINDRRHDQLRIQTLEAKLKKALSSHETTSYANANDDEHEPADDILELDGELQHTDDGTDEGSDDD